MAIDKLVSSSTGAVPIGTSGDSGCRTSSATSWVSGPTCKRVSQPSFPWHCACLLEAHFLILTALPRQITEMEAVWVEENGRPEGCCAVRAPLLVETPESDPRLGCSPAGFLHSFQRALSGESDPCGRALSPGPASSGTEVSVRGQAFSTQTLRWNPVQGLV